MKAAAILLILGRAPGTSSHSHRHGKAAGSSSPPDVWLPVGLAITLSLSQPLQQRATTFADMYIYILSLQSGGTACTLSVQEPVRSKIISLRYIGMP